MKYLIIACLLLTSPVYAYELTGAPTQTKDLQYFINPTGSTYSCEELKGIFNQNIAFIEAFSDFTFLPLQCTDLAPGVRHDEGKVIGFLPGSEFNISTNLAIAKQGIIFNIDNTDRHTLRELRSLGHHELYHNLGVAHTEYRYSIMTTFRLRRADDMGLPFRDDLYALCALSSSCETPTGWVTIDEDLTIRIPAVWFDDAQWSADLRSVGNDTWVINRSYLEESERMIEKAFLVENELHLLNVSWLGIPFAEAKFTITPDLKFVLIRGE